MHCKATFVNVTNKVFILLKLYCLKILGHGGPALRFLLNQEFDYLQGLLHSTILPTRILVHDTVFVNNEATLPFKETVVSEHVRELHFLIPGSGGAIRTFGLNVGAHG